jgi:Amt family ammonium transporter
MDTYRENSLPNAPQSETVTAINSDVLFKNCMGSVAFALTLLDELETNGMVQIETIAQHAAAADCVATAEAAHSLKGAAGIIGAESLLLFAAKIETAGKAKDIESILVLVDGIRQEMERCLVQIPIIRLENQLATS